MLITEIRKRYGLILVLLALALFSFILMDATNSRFGSLGSSTTVGKVNGKKVDYQEFSKIIESGNYGGASSAENAERAWNDYLRQTLIKEECKKMGITVSPEELGELFVGKNLRMSPIVQQAFGGNTGQVNPEQIRSVMMNPEQFGVKREAINAIKTAVLNNQLNEKLATVVRKSMYTPKWMLEKENAVLAQPLDFDFVMIPFASIKDEEVTVTDADLTAYINKNKEEYKREPSASIAYVEFDIKPSAADSLEVRKEVERMAEGLRTAKNDSLYINSQRGEYTGMFVNKKGLEGVAIKDSLDKIAIGTVVGPYLQGVEYKVAKLIDRKTVADSVRSRHILIKPEGDLKKTQAKADSLKALIETGKARFDSLAAKFGTDASVAKGGDLGYTAWGEMVPEFNNLIFTKAQIGKIYTVATQFGIHIIEVTGVKGSQTIYKMGSLGKKIHPSQTTHDAVFAEASKFLGESATLKMLDTAAVRKKGFSKHNAGNLGVNGFSIQPLNAQATQSSSREIIRWAHKEGAVGQIAPKPYEYTDPTEGYINKYIVVMLTGKSTQGIASLEEVREEVTAKVTKLKKAEKIKAKIQGTDLDAIATAFTAQKQTATGATILNGFVQGLGSEPRVLATAARLEPQKTEVVTGNAGVCVIKLTNKGQVNPIVDLNAARRQTSNRYAASVNYSLFEALKKNARITDNRDKFY